MAKADASSKPEAEVDSPGLDIFGELPCSQRPGAWMGAAYAYFNRLENEAKQAINDINDGEVIALESPSPEKNKDAAGASRSRSRSRTKTAAAASERTGK